MSGPLAGVTIKKRTPSAAALLSRDRLRKGIDMKARQLQVRDLPLAVLTHIALASPSPDRQRGLGERQFFRQDVGIVGERVQQLHPRGVVKAD